MEKIENDMSGWNEYAKYVLITIEKLSKDIERLEVQTTTNKEELLANMVKDRESLISLIHELNKGLLKTSTSMKVTYSILSILSGFIGGLIITILSVLIK